MDFKKEGHKFLLFSPRFFKRLGFFSILIG